MVHRTVQLDRIHAVVHAEPPAAVPAQVDVAAAAAAAPHDPGADPFEGLCENSPEAGRGGAVDQQVGGGGEGHQDARDGAADLQKRVRVFCSIVLKA